MDYLQSIIDNVIGYLTGPLGKSFFSLALIGGGYACAAGKLNWKWVFAALVGAGLAFGGKYLIGLFTGT